MMFDVVEMLAWFAGILLPDAYYRASGVATGKSDDSCYAETGYLSSKNSGLAIGVKCTSSFDNSWWILGLVAENLDGEFFTLSLSFDRGTVTYSVEDKGLYSSYEYDNITDVQWDVVINETIKALSRM
jgi:hypothetical protein